MKKSGHGGDLKYFSQHYNIPQNLLLDFSANINPLGPTKRLHEILAENIVNIKDYPEPNSESLQIIAQEKLQINRKNFIFGNGATELLFLALNYQAPKRVFIPAPSFSEYEIASKAVGAEIVYFNLVDDFQNFDLSFLKQLSHGDIIFICNPNNPTGTFFKKETLEEILLEVNKKGAYLFLDESFIDFIEEENFYTLREKIREENNLFILYSLTKIYGIPGLRLGMLFGKPTIISALYKRKDPWNVNVLAQKAGEFLLKDSTCIIQTKDYFKKERVRIVNKISEISQIKVYKPSANFIFIELKDGSNVEQLQEYLIKDKIVIRNCKNYPKLNNNFFRIAIKNKNENDFFCLKIKNYFSEKEGSIND